MRGCAYTLCNWSRVNFLCLTMKNSFQRAGCEAHKSGSVRGVVGRPAIPTRQISPTVGAAAGVRDPEVSEKAKRRRFSAEYKLRIVREADACKGDGYVAALLRREGLYSSHLSSWRRQRDEIAKAGLTSRKRGRKAKAEAPRIKELERENARLQRRLARVETMLEIPKKASELLGIPLNPIDDDEND